jgi:hypothetical protein
MMPLQPKLEDAVTGLAPAPRVKGDLAQAESTLNFIQRPVNKFGKVMKRWNDFVASERKPLVERYAEGSVSLICNLDIFGSGNGQTSHAVINDAPVTEDVFRASVVFNANAHNVSQFCIGDEELMFIPNVEQVKTPEGFPISSSVRLYDGLDTFDDLFRGFLFQSAIDGRFKSISGLANGKFGMRSSLSHSEELDFIHGVVESCPKIVDSIAKNKSKAGGKNFCSSYLKQIATCVRLTLNERNVVCRVEEFANYSAKVADVFFGPLNLRTGLPK